jgi:hypothetical protein
MHSHRRDFLRVLSAAGSTALLGAHTHGEQQGEAALAQGPVDQDALTFWTQHFLRPPSATLGPGKPPDARTPRFFVYTAKEGFRFATSPPLKAEELEKFDRPSVRIRIKSFKPSVEDSHKFESSQSGTLRVDVLEEGMLNSGQTGALNTGQAGMTSAGQAGPSEGPTAPKATTSISGLAVNGQTKLQPSSVKGLAIGEQEAITLTGGGGYLNWTFFLQQKEATWHQVIAAVIKYSTAAASSFAPILNLAPLPKQAWNAFNTMMGTFFPAPTSAQNVAKSTTWLFNPTLVSVAASQKAFQQPAFADGLPLIKGAYYFAVPQEHYEKFGSAMGKMKFDQDYVVPNLTPPESVFVAAFNAPQLKDVSYLVFQCEDITEAPATCGGTTKKP